MFAQKQIVEFYHPSIISFEADTQPVLADNHSNITTSTQHFKHGNQSLKWTWSDENASLLIKQPIPYHTQNPFGDNSVSTFVFWVYAPAEYRNAKLVFSFYKQNKLCSWFEYKLGFTGWSGAWVTFDRDMQGEPEEGMNELKIRVEGVEKGELFFDHIMLSSFQDVRQHTADFQAPFINKGTTNHWLVLLDSWNKQFDIPLANSISEKIISDIKTIEDRFTSIITEKSKPNTLQQLIKRYKTYNISYNEDGSIKGLPVFFERFGETYERLGAPRYNILYANEMGLSRLNKLMFDMAISFRQSNDEKEKQEISKMYIALSQHILDQGFRAGSAMGTLHHLGYSMRQFYNSAFLMRSELSSNQLDIIFQQAMEWFSGAGEVKTKPATPGMDVDAFNTTLSPRLASILMMRNSPEKLRYLQAFARWVNNGFLYADGTLGTFKIDGTMFHHRHNYPAYAVGGLEGAVNAVWILHNTSFAVKQTERQHLKDALLAMRFYCNLTTWPLSLSGRHPDGKGHLYPEHFARLALSGSSDESQNIDKELASAYLRLISDSSTVEAGIFKRASIKAESSPNGNRSFPYSSLMVHRRNNWMVSAMGHSRYLWATETYQGANLYGRYLNHGNLQILASGKPISNFGSGFKQEGWDWNHFPGTTAAEIPIKELRADIKNLDEDSGYEELLLSDESFASGISIGGINGVYAMKLHEHDKYNGSLRARKSFFFFDNRIIAIGSNIRSALPDNEVHTTLFQVYQPAQEKAITLDRKQIDAFPLNKSVNKNLTEISDGLSNYFFVKNGEVALKRTVQHSLHEETDEPTENPFSLAFINHGKKAVNDSYEYMVLIQPDSKTLKSTRKAMSSIKNNPYEVLQKDSIAHIVSDKASQTTAYVFFEAGTYTDATRHITVDTPCMVMAENQASGQLRLSVCDPDLRFYEGQADEQYDSNGKRIERSVYSRNWINNPSQPSVITVTIRGNWQLSEPSEHFNVKSYSNDKTTVKVSCQHGLSREVELRRKQ
ncbi:chondroitinase family polysaccharide lyase [Paludibacter sp.]